MAGPNERESDDADLTKQLDAFFARTAPRTEPTPAPAPALAARPTPAARPPAAATHVSPLAIPGDSGTAAISGLLAVVTSLAERVEASEAASARSNELLAAQVGELRREIESLRGDLNTWFADRLFRWLKDYSMWESRQLERLHTAVTQPVASTTASGKPRAAGKASATKPPSTVGPSGPGADETARRSADSSSA